MATNETIPVIQIIDGPSYNLIVDAFKYAYSKDVRIKAKFKIEGASKNFGSFFDLKIASLEHECGGGQSLNITGYASRYEKDFESIVKIFYNTRLRTGCLIFDCLEDYQAFI